jgi:hypothetical protein
MLPATQRLPRAVSFNGLFQRYRKQFFRSAHRAVVPRYGLHPFGRNPSEAGVGKILTCIGHRCQKSRVSRTGAYPRSIIPEWWTPSNRNRGQHHAGIGGRLHRNLHPDQHAARIDRDREAYHWPQIPLANSAGAARNPYECRFSLWGSDRRLCRAMGTDRPPKGNLGLDRRSFIP